MFNRWLPILFFSSLLVIGITIHRDYGLSWDDPTQRNLGLATWDYLLGKNDSLFHNENCYINPVIAAIEVIPEKILQPKSERSSIKMRHLFNFILCWVGLIFFYLLALRLFRDYRFALITCLLFVLTPRLFAHCFYNSKDLPFLFLYVVNAYLFVGWIQKPSWSKAIWMGIFSGFLTATRIVGILFPFIVVIVFIAGLVARKLTRREIKMIIVYLLLYPLAVYVFFPSIWNDPVTKIFQIIPLYSHHPFEVITLFMGESVSSLHVPWYYIPVWMGVTIPLGWLILFFAGIIFLFRQSIKVRIQFSPEWFTITLWFIVPLATEIILHANTYEDGRHMFFIEPALILIAVEGLRRMLLMNFSKWKFFRRLPSLFALGIFVSTSVYVTLFLIQYHPYQYSYFNGIGRKYAQDNFEKDYWGLSYRNALEYLVKYDNSDQINVRWKAQPCEFNLAWLNDSDRSRVKFVAYEQCDYYLTNYHSHRPLDASDEKIFEIKVQGATIMAIYKMHPPTKMIWPLP